MLSGATGAKEYCRTSGGGMLGYMAAVAAAAAGSRPAALGGGHGRRKRKKEFSMATAAGVAGGHPSTAHMEPGSTTSERCGAGFGAAFRSSGLPRCPPDLLCAVPRLTTWSEAGKIRVLVKLCAGELPTDSSSSGGQSLCVDAVGKQLMLRKPYRDHSTSALTGTGARASLSKTSSTEAPDAKGQNAGIVSALPRVFTFDEVLSSDASPMDASTACLPEVLQAVVSGANGCVFTYGHSRLGKSTTMIGESALTQAHGVIPCAIAWLFRLLEEQQKGCAMDGETRVRSSVWVSALDVRGSNETLTDLLTDIGAGDVSGKELLWKLDTMRGGSKVENLQELRAPTADVAAAYLDAACAKRQQLNGEPGRGSHLLFTLHVYQHQVNKASLAGGRSRLHLIDIGPCAKSRSDGTALTLSALGDVVLALLHGQQQFPHRDSKLATLLMDSLGNSSCISSMIVHVCTADAFYEETLQVVQLASRVHRMKVRKRPKVVSSASSDGSGSGCENRGSMEHRRRIRMGTASSLSDQDLSSSEQSVDTVIHVVRPFQLAERCRQAWPHARNDSNEPKAIIVCRTKSDSIAGCSLVTERAANVPRVENSVQPPTSLMDAEVVVSEEARECSPVIRHRTLPNGKAVKGISPMLSDDDTGSEGQRRVPRTNVRAWPKAACRSPMAEKATSGRQLTPAHAAPLPADEQWVDGPAALAYDCDVLCGGAAEGIPKRPHEMWVDGPKEFIKARDTESKRPPSHCTRSLQKPKSGHKRHGRPGEAYTSMRHRSSGLHKSDIPPVHDIHVRRVGSTMQPSKPARDLLVNYREASYHSEVQAGDERSTTIAPHAIQPSVDESTRPAVKSYVTDWVMKHVGQTQAFLDNDNGDTCAANAMTNIPEMSSAIEKVQLFGRDGNEQGRQLCPLCPQMHDGHSNSFMAVQSCNCGNTVRVETADGSADVCPTERLSESGAYAVERQTCLTESSQSTDADQLDISCDVAMPPMGVCSRLITYDSEATERLLSSERRRLLSKPDGASNPSLDGDPSREPPRDTILSLLRSAREAGTELCSGGQTLTTPFTRLSIGGSTVVTSNGVLGHSLSPGRALDWHLRSEKWPPWPRLTTARLADQLWQGQADVSRQAARLAKFGKDTGLSPSSTLKPGVCGCSYGNSSIGATEAGTVNSIGHDGDMRTNAAVTGRGLDKCKTVDSTCPRLDAHSTVGKETASDLRSRETSQSHRGLEPWQLSRNLLAAAENAAAQPPTASQSSSVTGQNELWQSRRVADLLLIQDKLKRELLEAKRTLMLPDSSWSYDLLVANNTSQRRDLNYVEALEKETAILQKRVDACKSRIMVVTSLL